jgi:NAD(P)-dependent dehydrogenase (short-subunit alcohol dehydrogenase family)
MRIALVTGANGGFGKLITVELIKAGLIVVAAMRDTANQGELVDMVKGLGLENQLKIVEMDVTKDDQVRKVEEMMSSNYGCLDVLVNNAGYSQGGFLDDLSMADWVHQYDTNVFGVLRTTKCFLPLLRNVRKGQIINISSVSGFFGFPGMGPYCSSKFAIEGYSESLRLELLPDNIFVSLVEPASFKTGIWEKGLKIGETILDEDIMKRNAFAYAQQAFENAGDPFEVANLVRKICDKRKPKFRYRVGRGSNLLWLIKKFFPWSIIEKTVLKRMKK